MKPIVIYSLPRTRSSAVLQAAKRTNKHWEPFNYYKLFGTESGIFLNNKKYLLPQFYNTLDSNNVDKIFQDINSVDSACKITCLDLFEFLPSRKWWNDIQNNQTHEIFVLTRTLREQILSHLLSPHFGYFKDQNIPVKEITIDPINIYFAKFNIDLFLRFLPNNINEITFEELPEEYFDKSTITIENQKSNEKLSYVKNIQEIYVYIDDLIKYYDNEWKSKFKK